MRGRGRGVCDADWLRRAGERGDGAPRVSCTTWRRPGMLRTPAAGEKLRVSRVRGEVATSRVSCPQILRGRPPRSPRDVEDLPPAAGRGTPPPEPAPGWPHRLRGAGAQSPDPSTVVQLTQNQCCLEGRPGWASRPGAASAQRPPTERTGASSSPSPRPQRGGAAGPPLGRSPQAAAEVSAPRPAPQPFPGRAGGQREPGKQAYLGPGKG